jgi:hypothetical protein
LCPALIEHDIIACFQDLVPASPQVSDGIVEERAAWAADKVNDRVGCRVGAGAPKDGDVQADLRPMCLPAILRHREVATFDLIAGGLWKLAASRFEVGKVRGG